MDSYFDHEKLDCYALATDFARWACKQPFPAYRGKLRDQLVRAADSVVLHIAEGAGFPPGGNRTRHHRIARGSAAECCAILDLVDLSEAPQRQQQLRRIGAMLTRMIRR